MAALQPPAVAASADPVADGSLSAEDFALAKAKESGQPYELTSARTGSSDTWALPNGKWSVKRYGTTVRVRQAGAWVATDPTLQFAADGKVAPKASAVSIAFSGGGTGPLLTGVKEGRTLSLTWPKALPKPTLVGNVATYANVLPDVDLQLKAEVEGFSQLLVVKTAEAAKHPDLALLKFKLDTVGLNVTADPTTGLLSAVNPAGQDVFTASAPMMWDSTTTGAATGQVRAATAARSLAADSVSGAGTPSDAFVAPSGAKDAQMPTTVAGDTLEIKPDQALLTGAQTKYPVYIDPSVAWGERQNWAWAYRSWPNNSYWNTKQDVRVGYESDTNGLSRTFFQLDTANIKGALISKSTFRVKETWSWSCTATPVELWTTGPISSKTTWNNQPSKGTRLATVTAAKGYEGCAQGNLEFDATEAAKESASKGWSSVTLGLYASNESDVFQWKRFDPKTITLETEYNNPPSRPKGLGTDPEGPCDLASRFVPTRTIGDSRVSLYATIDDPDAGNLVAEFQLFQRTLFPPSTPKLIATQSVPASRGKVATWSVPDATLPNGTYTWKVRAKDQDNAYSPWSTSCAFRIDRSRPSKPPVISSTQFPDGKNGWPATTGQARTPGTFTFSANGVADAKEILYYTDSEPAPRATAPGTSVTLTPPGSGPHFVYAITVDKAGNRSDTATYLYYAKRSHTTDGPNDLNGDGFRDIWTVDSQGALLAYAGQGNGKFAAATKGGTSFNGAQIGTQGDWDGDGYNDLVSLQQPSGMAQKKLWTYPNNGQGSVVNNPVELTVACPVKDPGVGCDYGSDWNGDDHWHDADQIIAPGDINGDGSPDLLVKQAKQLWAYYGSIFGSLDSNGEPVLVGNGDWDKFTVVAPGDLNGDGIPDLWLRDDASGDVFRTFGSKGTNGLLDPTTWGSSASRVKVASGIGKAAYPTLGSAGDVTGDKLADLWAVDANRQLATFSGTGTSQPLNVTGINQVPSFLGNLTAPTAQWKLSGLSSSTSTPSSIGVFPAETAGITWPSATIGGRNTPYAAFDGPQSSITTDKPVVDTRQSFTISAWVKPGLSGAVISQDNNHNSAFAIFADPDSKKWTFALSNADVDGSAYDWSSKTTNDAARFVPDTWQQLTAVYNADTGLMSLYVDGVLASVGHHNAATSPAPVGPLVMGRYKENGKADYYHEGLKGGISNVAVYPYAAPLTAPGATGPMSLTAKPSHCMDNDNARPVDGNKIQAWDCNMIGGGAAQKFDIRADGTIRHQDKCLDAKDAGTTNGTPLQIVVCHNHPAQQFLPRADGSLYNPVSGRCVDASNMETGTQLYLWDCNATNPQRWTIPALSTAPLPVPLW
ncbi:ricin-type beta-trefoil lectin domain protein [Streptomyces lavendulae]|uniref:ricin-type beta-trefoil lectin domain protein n=1 Tax=Streptomyces lavendulae TaxID=1914 RepID=UPI002552180D|nr:ricin-type beta-trefoil lectin domain protein [Streptomyces lavendulae]